MLGRLNKETKSSGKFVGMRQVQCQARNMSHQIRFRSDHDSQGQSHSSDSWASQPLLIMWVQSQAIQTGWSSVWINEVRLWWSCRRLQLQHCLARDWRPKQDWPGLLRPTSELSPDTGTRNWHCFNSLSYKRLSQVFITGWKQVKADPFQVRTSP